MPGVKRVVVPGPIQSVELERRRFILLLQAHDASQLAGDFSKSSPKTGEMVMTLMAGGLVLETLLDRPLIREIFEQVHAVEEGETIWA
jgi:hypothetical protein